ncbi:HEAT repeat domain-containing protein [Myxococcota bacterium]|nr:HEAT repeat domain-containing protein [Myxococcota bacterium]MBU1379238.1 HEAT repeat domain-containing protein [Myxococcota bacterium]MBU1496869.1 HEAT repeat domain-containing protein [Myxococcota bacterium]
MKNIFFITSFFLFSTMFPSRSSADSVDVLINTLKTSDNYKVRVTAAMLLSRHKGIPKAFSALVYALNNDKHPTVQGTAAMSLGKLGNKSAIPFLQTASKKGNSYVRKMAKDAIKLLENDCPPVELKGKQIYLNIGSFSVSGYKSSQAKILESLRSQFTSEFEKVSYISPRWPKCKKPSDKELKSKKMKGFMLDGTLIISHSGGELSCQLKVFLTTYPRKAIKMMTSANAALTGNLDTSTIQQCFEAAVPAVVPNVKRFLANQL